MPLSVRRILVPVDFSAGSDAAVQWAQALGDAFGAELVLLHVMDSSVSSMVGGPGGVLAPPPPAALFEEMRRDAQKALEAVGARVPGAVQVLREGSPRQEILNAADELKADLIVMGTHGRTGLAHLLFGSVAEHVVRHARVPVFTVPGGDRK
jgi:nucleotide-binding universal stress UspA family protein